MTKLNPDKTYRIKDNQGYFLAAWVDDASHAALLTASEAELRLTSKNAKVLGLVVEEVPISPV